MFDNIAFSMVIGLVFIYLLYSLLTTIVGEMLAGWLQIRPRMLRVAIERMLNDNTQDKIGRQRFGAWNRYFMVEPKEFKASLAGKFYNYPSIKYLSQAESEKKGLFTQKGPSYISAEIFALTLINMLAEKGMGKNKMEQVYFALKVNSLHIQTDTLKQISVILDDASQDFDTFKAGLMKWFNETMDRTTGWYKKKFTRILFWLGFILAVSYNVDSIRIAKILANDKDARSQLVNMGVALAKDSVRYKDFINNNGDSVKRQSVIDTGYSHITTDIRNANLVLGLGWSLDTLTYNETEKISNDSASVHFAEADSAYKEYDSLRSAKDALVIQLTKHRYSSDSLRRAVLFLDAILANKRMYYSAKADTASSRDSLFHTKERENDLARLLFFDSVQLRNINALLFRSQVYFNSLCESEFSSIQDIQEFVPDGQKGKASISVIGKVNYDAWDKIGYFILHILPIKASFWGLLITALMLSLGAPFWFGVLNKLVSLRSAGVKPEEKKEVPGALFTNDLDTPVGLSKMNLGNKPAVSPPNIPELTLEAFSSKIQHEQGIVAKALEGHPMIIMVMAQNATIINYLENKYGTSFALADNPALVIAYKTAVPNITQAGTAGGITITNKNLPNNKGTLGAFMTRTGSDKLYIISCWHVMKDNNHLTGEIIQKEIINPNDASHPTIAVVEDGFFSGEKGIDIGIAALKDDTTLTNDEFEIKKQHREVDAFDSLVNTPVTLLGQASGLKHATIFHYKANVRIAYPGKTEYMVNDVFSITTKDAATGKASAPTTGGDSGAVVIDNDGTPLGMIIGGNGTFSYAVKFTNIFTDSIHAFSQYSFKVENLI